MYLGMWIWSRQPAGVGTEHQDEEEDHTTVDATPVIQEQEIQATWCDGFRFQSFYLSPTYWEIKSVTSGI